MHIDFILYFSNPQIPAFLRAFGDLDGKKAVFFVLKSNKMIFLTECKWRCFYHGVNSNCRIRL
jgi:hypothetical protein